MIKALTRENIVTDIRAVLKERYGTMQAAADALGLETRELRRVTGMAKARQGKRSCNLEVQVKVLKQLGLEIRYDIYEIKRERLNGNPQMRSVAERSASQSSL